MPRQTSIQLTEATERQVDTLKQEGFGTFTDIVRIAIDRMYREEREMDIKSKAHKADSQYTVYLSEVDADYDQEPGFSVEVAKDMMPPHAKEFFTDRKVAGRRFKELTK